MEIKKFETLSENTDILISKFKDRFKSIFEDELLISNFQLEEREDGYYQLYCEIGMPIKNESIDTFAKLFKIFDVTDSEFNFLNNFLSVKIYELNDFLDQI